MRTFPKLFVAGLIVLGLAGALVPWRIAGPDVARAIERDLLRASGLNARISGRVTLKLLPRPRIWVGDVSVDDGGGCLMLDAPALRAELDFPSLMGGLWRVTSATLVEPTITLDLDRIATRRRHADRAEAGPPSPWPFRLRVRSGVIRTKSSNSFADLLTTGLDATLSRPANDDALVLSGTGIWRGTTVQFAGSLQHPAMAFETEGAEATLQADSALFTLSVDGLLSGGTQQRFAGRLAATTPALPKLLRALDGASVPLGTKRVQIGGDVVATSSDVSLSNAQLKLDRARFEGTLAFRRDNGRALVAGTLATDLLDLDALLGTQADRGDLTALYRRSIDPGSFDTDVDLRVSASATRIGRLDLDDTAFEALLRAGRLELTLDEGTAYGGLLKARAIANVGRDGIEAHADLSATRIDLGRLSDALSGQDRVSGILTGHAILDGRGLSARDVVAALDGRGRMAVDAGRLSGLSLGQLMRRLGRKLPADADHQGQPTTFDRAVWDFSVERGVLKVPEAKLTAPGLQMSFGAQTALPDGRIDVHAVAAQTDAGGAPVAGGQRLPFDLRGYWNGPVMLIGHPSGLGMPTLSLPLFSPAPAPAQP